MRRAARLRPAWLIPILILLAVAAGAGLLTLLPPEPASAQTLRIVTIAPAAGGATVAEGSPAVFTVSAIPASTTALAVNLNVADGTPGYVAPADEGAKTVTIPANQTSADYSVATQENTDDHAQRGSVTVTVTSGTGYVIGRGTAKVTVTDNDPTRLTLATEQSGATDLVEGGTWGIGFTIGRIPSRGERLEIPLTFGGTATRGDDYTISCGPTTLPGLTCHDLSGDNPRLVINGDLLTTVSTTSGNVLSITAAKNDGDSATETVTITLGTGGSPNLDGGLTGVFNTRTFNIVEPPSSITLTFTLSAFNTSEDVPVAQPVVRLSHPWPSDIALPITFTDGTALAGSDYRRTPASELVIQAGGRVFSFAIPIVQDDVDEPDETFTITINAGSLPTNVGLGTTGQATVTINDDDPTPVRLSRSGSPYEGGFPTLTVDIGRMLISGETLTVPLRFGGTASIPSDYGWNLVTAQGVALSGPFLTPNLTFTGPSAASADINLDLVNDGTAEPGGDTVTVTIGNLNSSGLDGGAEKVAGEDSTSFIIPWVANPRRRFGFHQHAGPDAFRTFAVLGLTFDLDDVVVVGR